MLIEYKNRNIQKVCENAYEAEKKHGTELAIAIHKRIDELIAADTVEEMIQFRIGKCHKLKGNRKNQYAVNLSANYRLIFSKKENNENTIQIALIEEITDYH